MIRYLALTAMAVFSLSIHADAEIMIDDFTEPQIVTGFIPNFDVPYSVVGDLALYRAAGLYRFRVDVDTVVDIGNARPSEMSLQFDSLTRTDDWSSISIALRYNTAKNFIDFTQGGRNNCFLVDFASLRSSKPLDGIQITVRDTHIDATYQGRLGTLPISETPFTVAIPFDSFVAVRGPAVPAFSFRSIDLFNIVFDVFGFYSVPDDAQVDLAVQSIRVGAFVPEPSSLSLGILVAFSLFYLQRRLR